MDARATRSTGHWTARLIVSTFGLGAFAIVILAAAPFLGGLEYSLPAVAVAIIGLVFAIREFVAWVSAGWVRQAVDEKRRAGLAVWPVRAESPTARWDRIGTLEMDEAGLTLVLDGGAVQVAWSELTTAELKEGGLLKGKVIFLEGPRSGSLMLEVLQFNAAAREDDEGIRACAAALEDFRSGGRTRDNGEMPGANSGT